jgi:cell filamentation protein
MTAGDRYRAEGPEAESEPGSRGRVLRNRLEVRSVREMARIESEALLAATDRLIDETDLDHRFTADDICAMHRMWLGGIYPWAGEYRQVNLAKGSFPFAAVHLIPGLMRDFERGPLREFTPCRFTGVQEQARALAVVHAELILIHPFREGNGRCSRLLALLMGLQAGLPALDFGGIRGMEKRRYIAAIHASLDRDYEPMAGVFSRVIARTLRTRVSASGSGAS